MRTANKKLEFYVLRFDFNTNQIQPFNIFRDDFTNRLKKEYKNGKIKCKSDLKELIQKWCLEYRGRTEYEIFIGDAFCNKEEYKKIDCYEQLMMNIDIITNYVNEKYDIGLK